MKTVARHLVLFSVVLHCVLALELKNVISDVRIPFHVNVWVIGGETSAYNSLESTLSELFPFHVPMDSKGVQYDNKYHIHFGGYPILKIYENLIVDVNVDGDTVTEFISAFKKHVNSDMTFSPSYDNLPVVIILPNAVLPKHTLSIASSKLCSQSFIDDVIFVDLSASSCDLSSTVGKRNSLLASGFTSDLWTSSFTSQASEGSAALYPVLRISSIIISAVRRFTVSNDLVYQPSFSAERVIVPIVFLKPRGAHDNETPLSEDQMTTIRLWLQNILLPSQTAMMLTATHFVEDHPQLTIALASASRWYVVSAGNRQSDEDKQGSTFDDVKVPYLDSSQLVVELAQIGDNLCRRLMVDAGHGYEDDVLFQVESFFQSIGKDSSKDPLMDTQYGMGDDMYYHHRHMRRTGRDTVISPVFVLSDLGTRSAMEADDDSIERSVNPLFDRHHSVVTRDGVSLVLHSTQIEVNTHNPSTGDWEYIHLSDASLSISEIISEAVAGMKAPHRVADGLDLTWVQGSHPFAPYGRVTTEHGSTHISAVLSWSSRRAIALSRGLEAIHRLEESIDRASVFIAEFSRPLSLLQPPTERKIHSAISFSSSFTSRIDISEESNVDALLDHVFSPLVVVNDIVRRGNIAGSDGEGVSYVSTELVQDIADFRDLLRAVLVQVADIMRILEESASLLSSTHVATAEANVDSLQSRCLEMERRLKETMDRCTFEFLIDGSGKTTANVKRVVDQNSRNMIGAGFIVLLLGSVFLVKKMQEAVERREKKRL